VEFAPLDELARRRLGDLYRAHGWFEDAYRQYLIPGIFGQTVAFAAAASTGGLADDLSKGIVDRFRSLGLGDVELVRLDRRRLHPHVAVSGRRSTEVG
jgi:hypothetical protein